MTKTDDLAAEVLRDNRHPFRALSDRPRKPQKNRYERRKTRELIKHIDWTWE